jgi:hypothetical protein
MITRPHVTDIPVFFKIYGEPCNNCERYTDGCFCENGHRQRTCAIRLGHIPELTYRRQGGCPDWVRLTSKTDAWWGEEPPYRCSGDYGGSKTSILG